MTDGQTDRRTDRQTDGQTDGIAIAYTRYSYAVARNEVALQQAEMRMVRRMCGVKLQDRVERDRLGLDDIISILQQNRLQMQWYGHVLQKEDNDWVKKCMKYEVEGARPRGRTKKTWRETVEKDCQACKLKREDATDHNRRSS